MRPLLAATLLSSGCIDGLTQIAGTGAIYHTRCSADMLQEGGEYRAQCTPEACTNGFEPGPVSHVVVALDPGRKVVGYAERTCIQDLANATARFNPAMRDPSAPPTEATP